MEASEPLSVKIAGVVTNAQDVGSSVQQVPTPEGKSRGLTAGEIAMARLIFKDSIDYSKVKVHNGEFLWFGLQPDNTAMTPDGEMYFNKDYFKEDFSQESNRNKHWFMHEMVHVWQHQLGYWVKLRGAIRIGLGYEYTLVRGKRLSDYNMEAQGDLLADYFALKHLDGKYTMQQPQYEQGLQLYEEVISDFLSNPKSTTNLP